MGQRIDVFMGEFRIVIPMVGVVFGFQLTISFSQAWADLDPVLRYANFGALVASAATLLFMLIPVSYHRFTSRLDESSSFLDLARHSADLALLCFPISLALSLYVQAARTFSGQGIAVAAGIVSMFACAAAWWIVPKWRAVKHGHKGG
jgi:hypothetical protein